MRLIGRALTTLSVLFSLAPGLLSQTLSTNAGPETRQQAVDFLTALVKIDTSNPPGNETVAAQYIKAVLDHEGIPSEIFESAPGRGSLVARLKGNGSRKPLLLLGHLDVVGVQRERWTVDPFAAILKDGFLYGRGAEDDKAMDAANLAVFLKLHRDKIPLDRDVILLAEAGEEGTTQYGIDYMVANHWDKIACEFALNEGGHFYQVEGKLKYAAVSNTEKVPHGMLVTAHGSSGHGSMPRMDNPITHLSAAIAKLGAWQPPMRLNETTRAFFAGLAKISPPEKAQLFTHLKDPAVQEKLRETEIVYNSMLRTSVTPTVIKGGFRENVIPADAEAILDIRALPDENIPQLVATMRQIVNDPAIEIKPLPNAQARPDATPSSIFNEMFQALERAQEHVFPEAVTLPFLMTGATDSAQLRAKGVHAYGISVPTSDDEIRRVHGNDERISVEALGQFVEYLWTAVTGVAAKH